MQKFWNILQIGIVKFMKNNNHFTHILTNTAIVGFLFLLSSCTPALQEPARVESLSSTSAIVTT